MGRRKGRTGAGGAVVSSASALRGGVVRGGGEDVAKETGGGGWLGKTPMGLLEDSCRRDKRLRPRFTKMPNGRSKCIIAKGKRGEPKGAKGEWDAVITEGEDDEHAALAALVQIDHGKPLHRVLPPSFRTTWNEWDKQWDRREKEAAERVDRRKEVETRKKEAEKKKINRPVADVTLSEKTRLQIEDAVLLNKPSAVHPDVAGADGGTQKHNQELDYVTFRLKRIGFAQGDVEIATQRANGDYDRALDWLCLNLDETELPKAFKPKADFEVVRDGYRVDSSIATSMGKRYASSRLAAERALRNCKNDEKKATCALFETVVGPMDNSPVEEDEERKQALEESKTEEAEALEAIYGEQVQFGVDDLDCFYVRVELTSIPAVDSDIIVVFRDVIGTYPAAPPVVDVAGTNIPASTRRALMRAIYTETKRLRSTNATDDHAEPILQGLISYLLQTELDQVLKDASEVAQFMASGGLRQVRANWDDDTNEGDGDELKEGNMGGVKPKKEQQSQREATTRGKNTKPRKRRVFESKPSAEIMAKRKSLPAWNHQQQVVSALRDNQVVVVSGATGSGKTTQVPQFILDNKEAQLKGKEEETFVLVTQPRRLAAISVAQRVATERGQTVGQDIGHQVRLDSKLSSDTRVLFCTTGILLRRLQGDRNIGSISHVVLDEVHERSIETDILLLLLREVLRVRKDLRVVLMSATLDAERFADYFGSYIDKPVKGMPMSNSSVPIISIAGRTYPVDEFYLEDVIRLSGFRLREGDPGIRRKREENPFNRGNRGAEGDASQEEDLSRLDPEARTLKLIDESFVNLELIERLVVAIDNTAEEKYGSILVFLPGVADISSLVNRLQSRKFLYPVPLHAQLSSEEQTRAFSRPPKGLRKVVCSTNVAETSVTVEDVVYVVDSVRANISGFDAINGSSLLEESFISKASAKQRCGRAGRVRKGLCYRLIKKESFTKLRNIDLPELLRTSLDRTCLTVLATLQRDPRELLALAVDQPKREDVQASLDNLLSLGAIQNLAGRGGGGGGNNGHESAPNKGNTSDVQLTALGAHLATLPVDVRVGKLLIYSSLLGCTKPVLDIAAVMSERGRLSDKQTKRTFNWGKSDLLAQARLIDEFETGGSSPQEFCKKHGVSRRVISSVLNGRRQLEMALGDAGFDTKNNVNAENVRVIKAALCAAMYPHVVRVDSPKQRFSVVAGGAVADSSKTEARELKLRLRSGQRVFLDRNSVNFDENVLESGWLVFNEKFRFGQGQKMKEVLRDSTMVPAYGLLLFGGEINVLHERGLITVDRWIEFNAPARIGVLVKNIREQLDGLLWSKIEDPALDTSHHAVLTAVTKILEEQV